MSGELALIVALVAYGNAYFHGNQIKNSPELTLSNSTFQNIKVQFTKTKKTLLIFKKTQEITGTEKWFKDLKERGANRLWLIDGVVERELPPRIASSFAGGGAWAIQVDYDNFSEIWTPNWGRGRVVFACVAFEKKLSVKTEKTDEAIKKLRNALIKAREFSQRIPIKGWTETFKASIDRLDRSNFKLNEYQDMIPDVKNHLEERRLISAAVSAWVFWGMGSWNDLPSFGTELDAENDQVSDQLYSALINAFKTGANGLCE